MEKVLSFITLVSPKKKVQVVKKDPEDNKVIECAIEAFSGYVISYDQHLLKIKEYKGIKIIKPEKAVLIF